jgi:hypothetical protein
VLTSAFGNKSSRIKVQALITFPLGEESLYHVSLISSRLTSQILLGADFLYHHKFSIDFKEECLIRCDPEDEGKVYRYPFIRDIGNVAEENPDIDPCEEGGFVFRILQVNDSCNVGEEPKRLLVCHLSTTVRTKMILMTIIVHDEKERNFLRGNARSEMFQRNGEVLMNLSDDEQGENHEEKK